MSYRDFRRYIARVHDLRVQRMPEAKWSLTDRDQTTALYCVNQGYHSHPTENGPQIYVGLACWMGMIWISKHLWQAAMQLDAICQDARAVLEWLE